MTGWSSSRPTVGLSKKLKPHDPLSHYFCICIQQMGSSICYCKVNCISPHWSRKWVLSVSNFPVKNLFNFYIVPVFMKVCMIQIRSSGSSDLAVFYLAHHVFCIMCVMPPLFLVTQRNSFWQHLDKVYWETFFTSQS